MQTRYGERLPSDRGRRTAYDIGTPHWNLPGLFWPTPGCRERPGQR